MNIKEVVKNTKTILFALVIAFLAVSCFSPLSNINKPVITINTGLEQRSISDVKLLNLKVEASNTTTVDKTFEVTETVSVSVTPGVPVKITLNALDKSENILYKGSYKATFGDEKKYSIQIKMVKTIETVSSLIIEGLTAPALAESPDTSIPASDEYSVTSVSWDPQHSLFEGEKVYTATIELKAKTGYTFYHVDKNSFSVVGATSVTNPAGNSKTITVTAVFLETDAATISANTINGLSVPELGGTPVTKDDLSFGNNTECSITGLIWNPQHNLFEGETIYKATIELKANTGYKFDKVIASSFSVTGAEKTALTSIAEDGKTIEVTAVFPKTAKEPPEQVTHTIISGVTPPVVGQTPAVAATDGTEGEQQFSATINWSPELSLNGKFKGETVYTATISLSANTGDPGYTFSGVDASLFGKDSVSGASTVSFNTETFVVTAVFPLTAPATVTDFTIEGLTPPAVSQTPDTSIPDSDEYSVKSLSWNHPSDSPFKGETVYTATIILEAKTGYTFDGVDEATNKFSLASATSVTNPAGAGKELTVTAVFPETAPATISANTINGLSVPELGGTPVIIDDLSFGNNTECSITNLSWSPSDNSFKGEVQYIATINISSKEGYTFKEASANLFTVSGASELSFQNMSSNGKDIQLVAVFPETAPATVTDFTIEGLTAPALAESPDTSIPENDEYSVTSVNWDPSDNPFKGEAAYTATIALEAKTGYTFDGVDEATNKFSIASATSVTNPAGNSKTIAVTAVFPETDAATVTDFTIEGLTPPAAEKEPDLGIQGSDEYSLKSLKWSPNPNNKFKGGTAYKATIKLEAKTGYTFNHVDENSFIVASATTSNPAGNSKTIEVTAVFPKTAYLVSYDQNAPSDCTVDGSLPESSIADSEGHVTIALRNIDEGIKRDGYNFTGWNTDENGGGTSYSQGKEATIQENLTLYAQWTKATPASCFDFGYENGSYHITKFTNTNTVNVTIPEYITISTTDDTKVIKRISDFGYKEVSSITTINIPSSITTIVSNPFKNCNNLTTITVDEANESYKSKNGVLYSLDEKTLVVYPCAKDGVEFSNNTTTIGQNAFYNYNKSKTIVIPDSVKTIKDGAFSFCEMISITIGENVETIGDSAFSNCEMSSITIGENVKTIGCHAFSSCKMSSITIGENVETIGDSAFSSCEKLKTVTVKRYFSDSDIKITTLGTDAFSGCTALETICVPNNAYKTYLEANNWSVYEDKIPRTTSVG